MQTTKTDVCLQRKAIFQCIGGQQIEIVKQAKELWRSKREVNRGKSREIAGNFVLKTMAITFLKNRDRSIVEGIPESNGDHFGGEI